MDRSHKLTSMLTISMLVALGSMCDVVRDFGAVGDNRTEDTAAVTAALAKCDSVHFPAGYKFLLRPVQLRRRVRQLVEQPVDAAAEGDRPLAHGRRRAVVRRRAREAAPRVEVVVGVGNERGEVREIEPGGRRRLVKHFAGE